MSASLPPDAASQVSADPPASPTVRVRVCALTDVGRTREHNEDAFLVADLAAGERLRFDDGTSPVARELVARPPGFLFVVADGLGGAVAGEVASHMAVDALLEALRARVPDAAEGTDPQRFAAALRDATLAANATIHEYATRHPELRGMGTTVTAAALHDDGLYVAQVGDSRAYIVREGEARQITKDQSLMQKLVEAGEITPEQAEQSARRNIILQALGPEPTVKVDLTHQPLREGDTLILCSDGLSGQVRPEEIAATVERSVDLDAVCEALVSRANETGGPDNITVVAARFAGGSLARTADGDEVGHRAFHVESPTPHDSIPHVSAAFPSITTLNQVREAISRDDATTTPAPAAPLATPSGLSAAELAERRWRARRWYVLLAALATVVAAATLWELLARR